jgi:hypothetical protein
LFTFVIEFIFNLSNIYHEKLKNIVFIFDEVKENIESIFLDIDTLINSDIKLENIYINFVSIK